MVRLASVLIVGSLAPCMTACAQRGPTAPAADRAAAATSRPTTGPHDETSAAAAAVADIRNADVGWNVLMDNAHSWVSLDVIYAPRPRPGSASERVEREFRPDDVVGPLLAALDDPDRFAAAHMLLLRRSPEWRKPWDSELIPPPTGDAVDQRDVTYKEYLDSGGQAVWARVDHAGLTVDLRLPPPTPPYGAKPFSGSVGFVFDGHPDVKSLPAVRDAWHRMLGASTATSRPGDKR